MDISETYIKMCDCEEIQGLKKFEPADYLAYQDMILLVRNTEGDCLVTQMISGRYIYYLLPSNLNNTVWLPRQDQLQEIYRNDWIETLESFIGFLSVFGYRDTLENHPEGLFGLRPYVNYEDRKVVVYEGDPYLLQFTSMEQLWLAFVMEEKFNKIWDGEKWKTQQR